MHIELEITNLDEITKFMSPLVDINYEPFCHTWFVRKEENIQKSKKYIEENFWHEIGSGGGVYDNLWLELPGRENAPVKLNMKLWAQQKKNPDYSNALLTETDKYNIELIHKFEGQK